jgi:hypothetical protein
VSETSSANLDQVMDPDHTLRFSGLQTLWFAICFRSNEIFQAAILSEKR